MKRKPLRLGTVSLLFAVVLACTAMLALLSVVTVRADLVMTRKYANRVAAQYAHEAEITAWLAEADEAARKGISLPDPRPEDGTVTLSQQGGELTACFVWNDSSRLDAVLDVSKNGIAVKKWSISADWKADLNIGQLWGGPLS